MRRLAFAFPLALIVACAPEEPAAEWTITVDTLDGGAGPVRVVNTPPEGGEEAVTWRLAEEGRIGPTSFGSIAQVAVDSGGRLAVLDFQAQELRVFGPDGAHRGTFGGEGEGPGELSMAVGVIADGNRLLVPEASNARLSVFDADSGFVTSHPTRLYSYGSLGWDAVIDTAGRIQVLSSGGVPGGTGQFLVRVYDAAMTPLDTLPYRTYEQAGVGGTGPGSWVIPVGARSRLTVAVPFYAGEQEMLDRTGAIWVAQTHLGYRLVRFLPGGDTVRTVEVGRTPRPIPPATRDSAIARVRRDLEARRVQAEVDFSIVPEVHPSIYGISTSDEGDLWVRTTSLDESPTRYDVLDADGRYRGTVEIDGRVKQGVEPVVRGERVWAVVLGELDEESVVIGRLVGDRPIR